MVGFSPYLPACQPLNLFFYTFLAYGTSEEESVVEALDFPTLFISLGIVLTAIISGLAAGYRWDYESFHMWANRSASVSGVLLILFSVFLSANSESSNFWSMPWSFYIGVMVPCLVGISLANVIARSFKLSLPETVAISIECCYQNTGIATSVAITMFDGEEQAQAVAVPLFYGVVEAVAIGIYCVWAWKAGWTKAPADEKLCTILANTYELENHQEENPADGENNEADDADNASGPVMDSFDQEEVGIEAKMEDHPPPSKEEPRTFLGGLFRNWFRRDTSATSTETDSSVDAAAAAGAAPKYGDDKEQQQRSIPPRNRLNTADTAILSTPSPRKSATADSAAPIIAEEAPAVVD